MNTSRDIEFLLEEIITLPSLPGALARIVQLLNDPESSLSDVGKAITQDPAVALKTLRLANSAAYGLREHVTSVEHAVALLGIKVIHNLVLTATVFDTLSRSAGLLYQHSIVAGLAARAVLRTGRVALALQPDEAFVYGLLHDIGKIILEDYLSDDLMEAETLSRDRKVPAYQVEREIIGADHAEVGGRLAMNWRLPESIASAILAHHDLSRCENEDSRRLAALLNVADAICIEAGFPSYEGAVAGDTSQSWALLGVESAKIPAIMDDFFASIPEVEELIEAMS
ncbi:MAG TPA: HDOD domain-containing protein [Candidatus Hydrogenedentes bacterium]|nr:HDOD domain-containing protein [Candidatus Hydrogenedentota bacterium]